MTFLPRDAMVAQYMLLSCVRPAHAIKTAKHRIQKTTPYDSQGTLVFWHQSLGEIPTGSHPTGSPNRGGV